MNLPRLIVADETVRGMVSPGVILVYALRRAGVRVRVFVGARPESELRLLKLLLEESVVSLDTYTCGSTKNLKTLFQKAADPNAVNVVLVSLGTRVEENYIQVRPEVSDLSKALSCKVIVVASASASAVLTVNAVSSVLTSLEEADAGCVMGIIFASVKNPREYQLLEQEFGRRASILSLGYIPKDVERPMPPLQELFGASAATRLMQAKSAALQLASTPHQIEWEILDAFGRLEQDWPAPEEIHYSPKHFKLAVVGDKNFSLEGGNSQELFRLMGCEVVDYDPWQAPFPMDAQVVYFPHSLTALYASQLLFHEPFVRGIKQSFAANKLIFSNGASSLLFGQYFISTNGEKCEGLGFFSFHGVVASAKSEPRKIEIRGTSDSIFSKQEEKMRGYAYDHFRVNNPGNVVSPVWGYRDVRRGTELGFSGWVKGYCFVTDLFVDLWSNLEIVNRWLSLRKR